MQTHLTITKYHIIIKVTYLTGHTGIQARTTRVRYLSRKEEITDVKKGLQAKEVNCKEYSLKHSNACRRNLNIYYSKLLKAFELLLVW